MVNDTASSRVATASPSYLLWLSSAAGLFAVAGGIATLIGWIADVSRLKDWDGNGTTMKANAAVLAALTGAALLVASHYGKAQIARRVVQALGMFVALQAALILSQHIFGIDLGIDTLLFDEPPNQRATAAPGRVGIPACTSFLLLGCALIAMTLRRFRRLAGALGVVACAISFLSLIGYLYGAEQMYDLPRFTGIALQTALMIFALGIGVMVAVPEHDPVRAFTSDTSDGLLVRRLLPVIFIVSIGLGFLRVIGQDSGLYDTAFGTAALVILLIAMLSGVLWEAAVVVRTKEDSLRESEERLRTTLESIGDGVITTDEKGLVINLNVVAENLTGWTTREALGKPLEQVFKIVNESTREPVVNPAIRTLNEGVIVGLANHTVLIARDGTERPIDDSASPIRNKKGEIVGCVLVFHDITDRRRTERTLVKSERDLRDLFDNATIGIHWVGPDGTILRANQNELDMLGYTREEFVGHNIAEFHADEDVIVNILQLLSSGETLNDFLARLICKDGSIKKVLINSNVFSEEGKFIHSRCFTRDVTAFELAQSAQNHLAAIVEASEDAIISKRLDGTITSWNTGAERHFGYRAEQAIGQHISLLIPQDRLDEEDRIIARLKKGERIEHYDTVRLRRDGTPIDVSLTISPIKDVNGQIIGASKFARVITQRKANERFLRESEERLRLALEAGRMGTWEWRIEENEVIWSPGLEKIHGLAPGTFDGTFEAYKNDIHPDDRERVLEVMTETVKTGRDHHLEYRLLLNDGSVRWVEGRGKLFHDDSGKPNRMIGVCTDISERKKAEQQLGANEEQLVRNSEVFRRLVEQSPFGIYTVDSQFCLHQVSVGAQPAFKNVRPLIGRDFAEAMRVIWPEPLATELINTFRHTLETGESYLAPSLTAPRGDTDEVESYEWQIHRVTLPDGQFGVVCYYFDSTVLRQTEEELRHVAADLSEADRRKNEFLAMLAHELRNPLAPIRNALQIVRMTGPHRLNEATDMMDRQVGQLVRLVDDLLDISRISSGKIELRTGRIELASFINHAVEASRPSCEAGGLELRVTLPREPIYLNGDPTRLAQVIGNLLNNSCKFTDSGGVVDLIVTRENGEAVIVIRDTGIGIDPNEINSIFDMFVQADTSLKRSGSGLGIGLTLVKNLVEMHGGAVSASSEGLGHGTEFVVRLPILSEITRPAAELTKTADDDAEVTKRRVLVVDDNIDSASSLEMLLKLTGHDVRLAHDGLEAVEKAEEFLPDLILLDIGLPKLNGYEAARLIRESSWGKNIILIALTGWGQEEDRQRSKEAGFDRHMVKPIEHSDLTKILEDMVQHDGY